jgi:hypothetical protein
MTQYPTLTAFMRQFHDTESCYVYLLEEKWGRGFSCRKCGHEASVKGKKALYRRCQKCLYDVSPTAHTIFHKLKFPIERGFAMVYLLSTMRKGVSSYELARQFGVHQETAWFFKRKVQRVLNSFPKAKLKENVEADETFIGGFEPGKPGRSKGNKQLVQVCIEVEYPTHGKRRGKIKNADARVLKDASSNSIKEALDHMVHEKAVITTDGWRGYQKATEGKWHNIEYSEDGANFRELHWYIFTLKNWIRGIRHKISGVHLQSYLDEFNYRFNRRNHSNQCPSSVLSRMALLPKCPYSQLVAL